MNLQKFTQKSLEALKDAQTLMASKGNSQITQEHLMLALIDGEGGIAADLIRRAGASVEVMRAELSSAVDESPRMTGGSVEADKIYISRELESALAAAETIASKMKDEYVSVEHIMLAIFNNTAARANPAAAFFMRSAAPHKMFAQNQLADEPRTICGGIYDPS